MVLPMGSLFTREEIEKFRKDTEGCNHVIHLNNAGAGLMPNVVTKAQLDHITLESEIGGYEASALQSAVIAEFYVKAAKLFNCDPPNVAFTSSATDSFTRALSSIPFEAGDIILADKDDFVSNQIQFLSLQKRLGVQIVHINNAAQGGVDVDDLSEKLKKYEPRLLAITHIPTNSGLVQPVDRIAEVYHDYKKSQPERTWYILDACQSVGQMKLDFEKLRCDFLSVTARKFLRGPRGTGILIISKRALDGGLEPMFIDMRGAEWIQKNIYKQQPDARRFEDWEFAYATVVGTKAAIEYCLDIGEDKIWQQVKLLANYTRNELRAIDGVRVLDRGPELSALVTFTVKNSKPGLIISELLKRKINAVPTFRAFGLIDFDEKGVDWAIRVSPHYYNTLGELEIFIASLKEIIK